MNFKITEISNFTVIFKIFPVILMLKYSLNEYQRCPVSSFFIEIKNYHATKKCVLFNLRMSYVREKAKITITEILVGRHSFL